ncbi:aminopeptidase P family protein, partial [candidate division WOR-3 bacterium]|nr:aminopeptidase P family protein [candidate division WOR-3 bacterium]
LITDYRFQGEIVERVENARVYLTKKSYIDALASQRTIKRKKRMGFESRDISYKFYWDLRKRMDWLKFKSFDSFVESLRLKKEEDEIQNIARACEIGNKVFSDILEYIKPGVREIEIAAEMEYRMKKYGGEKTSFDTIVASGIRSSVPHGTASLKKVKKGEFITLDFGTYYNGYASDMTRTVFLGTPSNKDKKIYDTVYYAQKRAREAVEEGIKLKYLDEVARDYIKKSGFGEYFSHSLGHGVGLDVHEAPIVSYKNNDGIIEKGMVFTIEPGIYLPGYQGVRIEDTVAILDKKIKILTNSKRELIVL